MDTHTMWTWWLFYYIRWMIVPAGGRDGPVKFELIQAFDGSPAHATSPKPSQGLREGKATTGLEKARTSSASAISVWNIEKAVLKMARNSYLNGGWGGWREQVNCWCRDDIKDRNKGWVVCFFVTLCEQRRGEAPRPRQDQDQQVPPRTDSQY